MARYISKVCLFGRGQKSLKFYLPCMMQTYGTDGYVLTLEHRWTFFFETVPFCKPRVIVTQPTQPAIRRARSNDLRHGLQIFNVS